MLENWVWKEESLRLMSKHYKDGTPLPKEMLDKLVASKNANAGGFNLRQVFLATFDQRLHTMQGAPNTAELVRDTCGPRCTARTCSSPGSTRRVSSTSRPH